MANPFDIFAQATTKHSIAALNGAEVILKTLSLNEDSKINEVLYSKGFKEDGTPILSMEDIIDAKIMRVSMSLASPKMSVKDLKTLSVKSMDAINEIIDIINPPKAAEEGKN